MLILFNSKKNIVFFYTPTELLQLQEEKKAKIRIGGYVKKYSLSIDSDIAFIITDKKNEVSVEYNGILPDLFREEQGVVVEGILNENLILKATKVFAKHDEQYMPKSLKKQLEKSGYWKRSY